MYAITGVHVDENVTLAFGRGGFQGYNSDSAPSSRGGYALNVKEELDTEG